MGFIVAEFGAAVNLPLLVSQPPIAERVDSVVDINPLILIVIDTQRPHDMPRRLWWREIDSPLTACWVLVAPDIAPSHRQRPRPERHRDGGIPLACLEGEHAVVFTG